MARYTAGTAKAVAGLLATTVDGRFGGVMDSVEGSNQATGMDRDAGFRRFQSFTVSQTTHDESQACNYIDVVRELGAGQLE